VVTIPNTVGVRQYVMGVGPATFTKAGEVQTLRAQLKTCTAWKPNLLMAGMKMPQLALFGIRDIRLAGKSQVKLHSPESSIPATAFSHDGDSVFPFDRTLTKEDWVEVDVVCLDLLHVLEVQYDILTMLPLSVKQFDKDVVFSAVFFGPGEAIEDSP
jgi:hypothetical protein